MKKSSKWMATIAVIFCFIFLSGLMQAGSEPGGRSTGVIGIILLVGVIAAIRAIWKIPPPSTDDITKLNKD